MAGGNSYASSLDLLPSPPKSKAYRRPRRAPAHLRTKTGCLTCRKRRKKCDEQEGTCRNCNRRWLPCIWPSGLLPGATVDTAAFDSRQSSSSTLAQARPTQGSLLVTSPEREASQDLPPSPEIPCSTARRSAPKSDGDSDLTALGNYPKEAPPPPRLPRTVPSSTGAMSLCTGSAVFDLVRSKWLRELFRPMASAPIIQSCYQQSMAMAVLTPFYMHALLASCAAEYPAYDRGARDYFNRLSAKHYVHAITGLREALSGVNSAKHSIRIASTVLILCIFERAKPGPSSGVGAHLSGLAQIIQSELAKADFRLGLGLLGHDDSLRRVVLEGFIFHSATSVPFDPLPDYHTSNLDAAIRIAEGALNTVSNDADQLLAHPESPVLGAPPGLFVLVREISLMHREYEVRGADYDPQYQSWQGLNAVGERLSQYRYLYHKGLSSTRFSSQSSNFFSPPKSPRKTSQRLAGASYSHHTPTATDTATTYGAGSNNDPPSLGPTLYILAAEILLADMLRGTHNLNPPTSGLQTLASIPSLVSEGVQLVSLLQPATDYYAEYYGWPIYVLARFASRKQDRAILLTRVEAFYEATRNGTMARLAEMLRGNSS